MITEEELFVDRLKRQLLRVIAGREMAVKIIRHEVTKGRADHASTIRNLAEAEMRYSLWGGYFPLNRKAINRLEYQEAANVVRAVTEYAFARLVRQSVGATNSGDMNSTDAWVRTVATSRLAMYAEIVEEWKGKI